MTHRTQLAYGHDQTPVNRLRRNLAMFVAASGLGFIIGGSIGLGVEVANHTTTYETLAGAEVLGGLGAVAIGLVAQMEYVSPGESEDW